MAIVRFQPYREMEDIQRQMNRLFEDMITPTNRQDGVDLAFTPAAEFDETDDAYQLKLEVPGLEPDDINIEATAEAISISGERQSETKAQRQTRSEFRYGKFQRILPLPGRIKHQDVAADYKNGVLKLTLPKADEEKNRVVKVSLNHS
ncbi:Spore protein SP21 [Acaryochloris thomasi RCC1774]|uniref:Spore protein SP21 n=1 Tax=Acaryochloris thomasi RCC1774 TaxID=1764569 RepID=A0A2W1JPZ5_9CYAN|nr:Hsp20/alpha crystallin family protein [Acaryochloris thomasi]PZD70977.1 Spore protein SP21 [Acaryochloris thomasi RCC1774]